MSGSRCFFSTASRTELLQRDTKRARLRAYMSYVCKHGWEVTCEYAGQRLCELEWQHTWCASFPCTQVPMHLQMHDVRAQ
eukprot:scaffold131345_cov18-Tisochrysis_lutea.AAC.1